MLNMGFAEDVETILADTPEDKNVALFSATMPAQIRRISKKYLTRPGRDHGQEQDDDLGQHHPALPDGVLPAEGRRPHAHPRGRELRGDDRLRPHQERDRDPGREAAGPGLLGDGHQRRRRPGRSASAPSTSSSPASSTSSSPPTSPPAASTSSGSATSSTTTSRPTPSPTCTASAAPAAPGRSGDAISFVTPRERYLLKHDREGHPPAADPDAAADGRGRQRHPARALRRRDHRGAAPDRRGSTFFRDIVAHYVREHDVPEVDVAAALAVVAPGRRRRCCSTPRPSDPRRQRAPVTSATTGARPRSDRGPRERAPRRAGAATSRWRRTGSRSASGTRSSRARSSARIANEGGLRRAGLRAHRHPAATSRWSSCRPSCPATPGTALPSTRISGKLIELRRDGGPPGATAARRTRRASPAPRSSARLSPADGPLGPDRPDLPGRAAVPSVSAVTHRVWPRPRRSSHAVQVPAPRWRARRRRRPGWASPRRRSPATRRPVVRRARRLVLLGRRHPLLPRATAPPASARPTPTRA